MFLVDSADFSIPMALLDLVPVILFFLAGMILIRDMYNKLVKGNYALLATGTIMVFLAGLLKAIHKILAAAAICDFVVLNKSFFPMQGFGFAFFGFALLGILYSKKMMEKGRTVTLMAGEGLVLSLLFLTEVPVYESSIFFIVIQILGCALGQWMLFVIALKMKKPSAMVCFVVAFVFMLAMGYLTSKFSSGDLAKWNWIAEVTNIISTGALLGGCFILHKNGLEKPDALWKANEIQE